MNEEQRRKVCQLIAGMVISDEVMEPEEEAFLDRVIAQFGLESEGRDAIFPLVSHEDASLAARALPPEVQQQAFELLIQAARADGVIAPEEVEYLHVVGDALGMSAEETTRRLGTVSP